MATVLDYQRKRLAAMREEGESGLRLSETDCAELFEEAILFYYRYLHLFQLEDWERTVRDTTHNLKLFDLVKRCADRGEDREYLEQWRPYLIRMHATALAMIQLKSKDFDRSLIRVLEALECTVATVRPWRATRYLLE